MKITTENPHNLGKGIKRKLSLKEWLSDKINDKSQPNKK